jgi:hypothetical protein
MPHHRRAALPCAALHYENIVDHIELQNSPCPCNFERDTIIPTSSTIMASVTSLDKDMRKLRMDRYTPAAANEVRTFIEESLGERLAGGDLLDALKDGVALCKYDRMSAIVVGLDAHCLQTRQPRINNTGQVQNKGCHAIRTDGEYLLVPPSMQKPAYKPPISRHVPHGRSIRIQRPGAGPTMPRCIQQGGQQTTTRAISKPHWRKAGRYHEPTNYRNTCSGRRKLRKSRAGHLKCQ